MATSSRKPPKSGRNRLPDTRYVKTTERFRLHNPDYTMAFATKQVQQGFRLSMTPSMLLVKRGQEYRADGSKLWNRGSKPTAAFKALLHHFAMHLLQQGAGKAKTWVTCQHWLQKAVATCISCILKSKAALTTFTAHIATCQAAQDS